MIFRKKARLNAKELQEIAVVQTMLRDIAARTHMAGFIPQTRAGIAEYKKHFGTLPKPQPKTNWNTITVEQMAEMALAAVKGASWK